MLYTIVCKKSRTAIGSFSNDLLAYAYKNCCKSPEQLTVERRRKDYQRGDSVPKLKKDQ